MNTEDKKPLRIRYEYQQEPGTRMQYVHGIWGGITPQGELELNFYTESDKLPEYSERIVAPDGSFGHEVSPDDDMVKLVTRSVHSRLLLNYHTARAVMDWLQDKLEILEEHEEQLFFDDEEGNGIQ